VAADVISLPTMRWALLMLGFILLLFLLLVIGLLLVRMLRRNRERLERRRAAPTKYVDAWSLHKLPDGYDSGPDDGERPEEPQ